MFKILVRALTCRCKSSLPEERAPATVSWWSGEEASSSKITPGTHEVHSVLFNTETLRHRGSLNSIQLYWPILDRRSRLLLMKYWSTDSSLPLPLPGMPDIRIKWGSFTCAMVIKQSRWGRRAMCTSVSLSELDSVSLAPAVAPASDSECGTATMVPSWLTWAFSVILSMPERCQMTSKLFTKSK